MFGTICGVDGAPAPSFELEFSSGSARRDGAAELEVTTEVAEGFASIAYTPSSVLGVIRIVYSLSHISCSPSLDAADSGRAYERFAGL